MYRYSLNCSTGFQPFMEYAGSYALFNYRLEDPKKGMEYSNLRLIRAFEHGLDPKSSEAGFVLVHVAMVRHSGDLVAGADEVLKACEQQDRKAFDAGMTRVVDALQKVNHTMNGELYFRSVDRSSSDSARNVDQEQTDRVYYVPNIHFRYRQPIDVSGWRGVRGSERRAHVLPGREWRQ
jgi:hypothetical protein